jgi:hypothetical protein
MAVEAPPIVWIGTNGHNVGYGAQGPIAIVNHIAEGTVAGCDSWFSNPAAGASTSFALNGQTIHQYVRAPYYGWAHGVIANPSDRFLRLQREALDRGLGSNPNVWALGIEHEGYTGNPMPAAQWSMTIWLAAWLAQTYGIPIDRDHIIGHRDIDSVNRKLCPGWSESDWDWYIGEVQFMATAQEQIDALATKTNQMQGQLDRLNEVLVARFGVAMEAWDPDNPREEDPELRGRFELARKAWDPANPPA